MRMISLRSSIVTLATCALVSGGLVACSSEDSSAGAGVTPGADRAGVATGSTSAGSTPAAAQSSTRDSAAEATTNEEATLSIVTSTNVWSDIADEVITSDNVTITPILNGDSVDPHSFSPSAADLAKAKEADLVVLGGGHMDAWLTNVVTDQDRIIHALPLEDHESNPHVWYDLDKVSEVARQIESKVQQKAAGQGKVQEKAQDRTKERAHEHTSTVTTDAAAFIKKLDALKGQLGTLPQKSWAATEPIAEYLLAATPMKDVTPEGYRNAAEDESEPAAADVAQFLEAIRNGSIDVLIFNPQAETDVATRIRDAAAKAAVPVVEMKETPAAGESYLDFMTQNVENLQKAIQG